MRPVFHLVPPEEWPGEGLYRLVEAPIRVEDAYGTGTSYPHLYGPVPMAAAVGMHRLRRDADGRWAVSPAGGAAAAASPDR